VIFEGISIWRGKKTRLSAVFELPQNTLVSKSNGKEDNMKSCTHKEPLPHGYTLEFIINNNNKPVACQQPFAD